MKIRTANQRNISMQQDLACERNMGGYESISTSKFNVKREPISMRNWPGKRTSTIPIDGESSKINKERTAPGFLDDFLNANGPLSVTIEAEFPSPDKTTSEMVSLERIPFQLGV